MDIDGLLAGLVFSILVLYVLAELRFRSRWSAMKHLMENMERAGASVTEPRLSALVDRGFWKRFFRPRSQKIDLAAVCTEVASRLQAGNSVSRAWEKTWHRYEEQYGGLDADGIPLHFGNGDTEGAGLVVAATRFSALSGAPLKDVLFGLADSLNDMEEGRASQKVAFAGPRLSARILNALPFVGLGGAQVLGAAPFVWFASGILPGGIALIGLGFAISGNLLSRGMVERATQDSAKALQAPVLCDLVSAGLRGGAGIPTVLRALGESLEETEYERISRELTLGAPWKEAWDPTPLGGDLLEVCLEPGWEDGVSPIPLLRHGAQSARKRSAASAKEAAEKLAVKLALPLGGLLLPAFVFLGLIPVFFSLVGSQVGLGGP